MGTNCNWFVFGGVLSSQTFFPMLPGLILKQKPTRNGCDGQKENCAKSLKWQLGGTVDY